MKRYSFRLERLLALRAYKERMWEMKLAEATGKCVRLENLIRDLREESLEYAGFSSEGLLYSTEDIIARESFRGRLAREILAACGSLEKARAEREEVNRSYLAASRERKVLDKLKERKAEEYYEEERRREGKIMDEAAMFRKIFAGGEGGE
jgi:flagellar FliJ protein